MSVNFKKIFLIVALSIFSGNLAFASDNVLQAIQVDGVKDSYNIILKSDDVAELRKTVQAPNKMILDLKGIRASKAINTIYNNTASVDSVVVESTGEDTVKILIQADNVGNAGIHFDTLKTPLGVLGKTQPKAQANEIVLSKPMESYTPVYTESQEEETTSLISMSAPIVHKLKNILKNEKISWMVTFGLLAMFVLSGLKAVKGKDSDIKIGLSQSLRDREVNLYRSDVSDMSAGLKNNVQPQSAVGTGYGLRAYQNGSKNPYLTSETQSLKPRPAVAPSTIQRPIANSRVNTNSMNSLQSSVPGTMQATMQNPVRSASLQPALNNKKAANIDSMKFLESMTKIYEKNGRSDLAQGLKANMKKAKVGLA